MRKVVYTVTTPQLEKFETTSIIKATSIVAEHKGSILNTHLVEIENPKPQLSERKIAFLKSGAKPLYPYKGV